MTTNVCIVVLLSVLVSKEYHLKSKKGQRDERYKERLKMSQKNKYKERISRSTVRSKVCYWRKQLERDLRAKASLETALQESVLGINS